MSEIDQYANGSEISVEDFESFILADKKIVRNPAGGNCLFHALSYLLKKRFPKQAESITNKVIRKDICDYYEKKFRSGKSATPESAALAALSKGSEIEKQLFQLYTFGSAADATGNYILEDHYVEHQLEVCNRSVWGEEADIIVACILYNINIVVFSLLPDSDGKKSKYLILTYKNKSDVPTLYLHLKMDGQSSHYEAIYNKSSSDKSKTKKSRSKENRSTRKGKHESIVDKLTRFYEKVDKFVPSDKKADIERDFLDIQVNLVTIMSLLESLHSKSSNMSSEQESNDEKKIEELANLQAMLTLGDISEADKTEIRKLIEKLEDK
jgi:hypothetical protein